MPGSTNEPLLKQPPSFLIPSFEAAASATATATAAESAAAARHGGRKSNAKHTGNALTWHRQHAAPRRSRPAC